MPNAGRWEIGPIPVTLTDLGKQIFGVDTLVRRALPASVLAFLLHTILIDVMHRAPPFNSLTHLTSPTPCHAILVSELTAQTNNPL